MREKHNIFFYTIKHLKRYKEIIGILARFGFGEFLSKINLYKYLNFKRKDIPKYKFKTQKQDKTLLDEKNSWIRIRLAIEELGPTFIKLGQIMSTRPDLFPEELIAELQKLQDSVPAFDSEKAVQLVENELDCSINDLFDDFDKKPLASASIAQVHIATLKNGKQVAIKIQRPNIKNQINIDLDIMLHLARIIQRNFKNFESINLISIVKEFKKIINKELSFVKEANNIERFDYYFKDDNDVYIPKIYRRYSTDRILTMEYIKGIKISRIKHYKKYNCDRKIIAKNGVNCILKQIFIHGFFHADPHPGNIIVLENNVICLIDFGMMGIITEDQKNKLGELIISVLKKDSKRVTQIIRSMLIDRNIDNIQILEQDIAELLEENIHQSLKYINMGDLIKRLTNILYNYQLKIAPNFYILFKSLMTIEGIGRRLVPNFDIFTYLKPFASTLIKRKLDPKYIAKKIYTTSSDINTLMNELPFETREMMEKLKYGQIKINIEHKGLEPMLTNHDRMSNRIVFAIIVASLIIGSSLIVLSDVPPKWFEIPIIGLFGYLAAGIIGFWLLFSILRHRKM